MPTAKPKWDPTGRWKEARLFGASEWQEASAEVQRGLRHFYPYSESEAEVAERVAGGFRDPADDWAHYLLDTAHAEVSLTLSMRKRPSNEAMREEQKQILGALEKAADRLTNISVDLRNLLPHEVEPLECRDNIKALIPHIEALEEAIKRLPKAVQEQEAHHDAACKMAYRILQILSADGIPPSATAESDVGEASTAVKILMILGKAVGLDFVDGTWKEVIRKVQPKLSASPDAP